jgi:nitroimidazol reductase NimA-like FMN-containing flavoprotein (pyridoxamine 5'-phosphate oxidase superfamily)
MSGRQRAGGRAAVRRLPELARYDAESVARVLDAGVVAHVGIVDAGAPVVVPMVYGRIGRELFLHGSVASRLLRALGAGAPVCVTVTVVDGVLLARSAFNTSMSYRSVVVHGVARSVDAEAERLEALRAVLEHLVPGHWARQRPPNERELAQTRVVALPLDEASVKVSTGPVTDEDEDYALPHWAGELPLLLEPQPPVADHRLAPGTPSPPSVAGFGATFRARRASGRA